MIFLFLPKNPYRQKDVYKYCKQKHIILHGNENGKKKNLNNDIYSEKSQLNVNFELDTSNWGRIKLDENWVVIKLENKYIKYYLRPKRPKMNAIFVK